MRILRKAIQCSTGVASKAIDHTNRSVFEQMDNWAVDRLAEDNEFYVKAIYSDKTHFHLGGYVNKKNVCIWSRENPRGIIEQPMYLQ